jgi:hypothetical protein
MYAMPAPPGNIGVKTRIKIAKFLTLWALMHRSWILSMRYAKYSPDLATDYTEQAIRTNFSL